MAMAVSANTLEKPTTEPHKSVTIRATAEAGLARNAELESIATALLDEANQLQERVKNLRTQAHRIRVLIKSDAGRE